MLPITFLSLLASLQFTQAQVSVPSLAATKLSHPIVRKPTSYPKQLDFFFQKTGVITFRCNEVLTSINTFKADGLYHAQLIVPTGCRQLTINVPDGGNMTMAFKHLLIDGIPHSRIARQIFQSSKKRLSMKAGKWTFPVPSIPTEDLCDTHKDELVCFPVKSNSTRTEFYLNLHYYLNGQGLNQTEMTQPRKTKVIPILLERSPFPQWIIAPSNLNKNQSIYAVEANVQKEMIETAPSQWLMNNERAFKLGQFKTALFTRTKMLPAPETQFGRLSAPNSFTIVLRNNTN